MQTKSKIILIAIAVILVAFIARSFLGKNREPDSTQIQDQLQAAAVAAENKDAPDVMSVISDNYTDGADNNPERLNLMLRRGMSDVSNLSVVIAPATITVNGYSAHSSSYVTIKGDGQVLYSQLLELDWQKESTRRYFIIPAEAWRIVHSSYSGGLEGN